jgi:hypothetical protein
MKLYKLIGPDRKPYESTIPGTLGGHRGGKGYGRLNQTTEDWHTLVGAILVIAHRKAAHSRANTRFAPTRGLNAVYQCHVV